ncbi:unnamed protein product, partial [Didymodactylos carnosus]
EELQQQPEKIDEPYNKALTCSPESPSQHRQSSPTIQFHQRQRHDSVRN